MRGRKPELSPDCDALTATTKPPVWSSHHRDAEAVTPADRRIRHGVLVRDVTDVTEIG
ncbi:hypothetical protein [Microvirga aerophila]|uniref:Uncharacterized protein n=1 Tax=Microvirga aerophila TaxID=670291 RepID=A0A512C153_9HYPH|nr:hypothetical protein [Microvirga aerophila]GEO17940.1 hypothetical protein MAE02_56360 [Microvirga aerophila]